MTGWSIRTGAVVGGVLGICHVVFGGMKEVGWINLVNATVMYLGPIAVILGIGWLVARVMPSSSQ